MALLNRIERLEAATGTNWTARESFELSRPELLAVTAYLMIHNDATEAIGHDRLAAMWKQHNANMKSLLPIPFVFQAAKDGEEFCHDLEPALSRAEVCGIIKGKTL